MARPAILRGPGPLTTISTPEAGRANGSRCLCGRCDAAATSPPQSRRWFIAGGVRVSGFLGGGAPIPDGHRKGFGGGSRDLAVGGTARRRWRRWPRFWRRAVGGVGARRGSEAAVVIGGRLWVRAARRRRPPEVVVGGGGVGAADGDGAAGRGWWSEMRKMRGSGRRRLGRDVWRFLGADAGARCSFSERTRLLFFLGW
ncbi:hypothetical protein GQ55_2G080200 [Panicum hallii var. hallii]|uniref:Uncharacterized protein n=1 Tax=Panicum hallii var. hallii TaxID=1504633 RepID=A0A2T7EML8_9POAL|nr:hypothetical protein GQ55_2G080200 [Panicum hallii var. hallii]